MPRICSIHQPSYWPYLGLFDKVIRSDVFVFLDDVQYVKNEFKNRNQLFINSARASDRTRVDWITLPVRHASMSQTIGDTFVTNLGATLRKHLTTLRQAYGAAAGLRDLAPQLEDLFRQFEGAEASLADINSRVTLFAMKQFNIKTEIFGMSSNIQAKSSEPTQRLIDICKHVGADTYLAGVGAKDYMRVEVFERQGIEVQWQEWHPFEYPQIHSPDKFVAYLSCLDLLLNEGRKAPNRFSR
jgi:hypothetical protein